MKILSVREFVFVAVVASLGVPPSMEAQENYEIQVYPSKTADKKTTLFELHSNFTGSGSRTVENGVIPTQHALHETLEITHGVTDIFELGFYVFTSENPGNGFRFVGVHLRPRIRAPESLGLPVGLSLSTEFGPTRTMFDENSFGIELRPIIDQTVGRFYWSFNPNIEWALKGPDAGKGASGMAFNPNVKLQWSVTPKIALGGEYYGTTGSLVHIAPSAAQSHMLYPSIDLFLSPDWEFNAGYGVNISGQGDRNIFKVILGRRVKF